MPSSKHSGAGLNDDTPTNPFNGSKPNTLRSRQIEVERTQVGEKAKRFIQKGMLGLVDQRTYKGGRKPHDYPELVAAHMLYLKHD